MSMVTKWLHIQYLGGDPWVLPIWSAVNSASTRGTCGPITDELGELGMHLSTRLTTLPRIYRRINKGAAEVRSAVSARQPHHEFTPGKDGYAFDLNDDVKFNLLLDLDSLLFELNSCCELMTRLFEQLYAHAGRSLPGGSGGRALKGIVEAAGQATGWFRVLDLHRNFFIHSGAPYFAVDLSGPSAQDLLIMKNNLRSFEDESAFVRLTSLAAIVAGFTESKPIVQQHLVDLFAKL